MSAAHSDGDPLATIGDRIVARLIDWLVLMTVALIVGLASTAGEGASDPPTWAVLVTIGAVFLYEAGLVAARGKTIGKRIVGIEIVALATGGRPTIVNSAVRVVPIIVLLVVLQQFSYVAMVFVYFSAAFMTHNRGVLDLLAGTVVVQRR